MSREIKRDLRESLQEKQAEINRLKAKNKEMFTFLQAERKRIGEQIQESLEGTKELLLVTNLVLGEFIRKYGEITIPIPKVENKFAYTIERDEESGTMTFKAAPDPDTTADIEQVIDMKK